MKKSLLLLHLFFFFLLQVNSQSAKEGLYGAWSKEELVTDAVSKISINERYLFMSNGTGGYVMSVKQTLNNKRANPAFTASLTFSWSIVEGKLKLIFDKESRKTTEANASEEKWKTGAEFWAGLLERNYYKKQLAGQTIIIAFKKQSAAELLLDGTLYKKQ